MLNGLFSAASGMFNQQTKLDVIAGNVANAAVPGYKGERAIFRAFPHLLRVQEQRFDDEPRALGKLGGGAKLDDITTNFAGGQIVATNQSEDLAIFGEGFFHLESPDGEFLSRNGSFYRDNQGFLRNSDGNYVVGENGRIQIVESDFHVNDQGEIFVERTETTPEGRAITRTARVDQLKLSRIENLDRLERLGNSLYFRPTAQELPVDPMRTRIGQGYLEMANVNAIEESIKMVDTFRIYEASQRLVQATDDTLDMLINRVGRA